MNQMLHKSWAIPFAPDEISEQFIEKQTLKDYEMAVVEVLHYLTPEQKIKYCQLIQNDLQTGITAGRMRKLLLDARYAINLLYEGIDIFCPNRQQNLAQLFKQKEIPFFAEAFCSSNNLICPNHIILEDTGYQLNCSDFLLTNDINFVSYKNYTRILNIYCALAKILLGLPK